MEIQLIFSWNVYVKFLLQFTQFFLICFCSFILNNFTLSTGVLTSPFCQLSHFQIDSFTICTNSHNLQLVANLILCNISTSLFSVMAFRTFIFRNSINSNRCMRLAFSTQPSVKENNKHKIKSWQVHSYGGLDELQLTLSRRPIIRNPNDVIVKVTASSVNPIDVAMLCRYYIIRVFFVKLNISINETQL